MANSPSTGGFAIHVACARGACPATMKRLLVAEAASAGVFMGYMDGAARSGERAAPEVRSAL